MQKTPRIPLLFADKITENVPDDLELTPYQIEGVFRIAELHFKKRSAVLLSDSMGLGKTAQAVTVISYMRLGRVVVVCPASVRGVWEAEIPKWSKLKYRVQAITGTKDRIKKSSNIIILSYELTWRKPILRQLAKLNIDLVIFDEAHRLANLKSNQTKACLGNLWNMAKYRLPMTGSVMRNKVIDMYPLFARTAPELFPGGYWGFAKRYCYLEHNHFGTRVLGGKSTELKKLNKLAKQFTIRRLKSKVCDQLPDKIESKVYIECEWAERDREQEAFNDFSGEIKKSIQTGHIDPEMARIRAELGLAKVEGVCDYIQDSWQKDSPLVLFCHHRKVWDALYENLTEKEFKVSGIHGGISKNKRDKPIRDFQAGKADIFLATYAAAEGITLTKANRLAYAEMSWSLDKNEQAADRIHRIGQIKQVYILYLLARCEEDDVVFASYKKKRREKERVVN